MKHTALIQRISAVYIPNIRDIDQYSGSKDFINKDGKARLFEILPACNPKVWPPYWKWYSER